MDDNQYFSSYFSLFIWLMGEPRFSAFRPCGSNTTGLIMAICGTTCWPVLGAKNAAGSIMVGVKSKAQWVYIYSSFWALSTAADRAAWNWRAYCRCNSLSLCKSSWNVGRHAASLVLTTLNITKLAIFESWSMIEYVVMTRSYIKDKIKKNTTHLIIDAIMFLSESILT